MNTIKWNRARPAIVISVAILMFLAAAPKPVMSQNPFASEFKRHQIVVEIRPGASIDEINKRHRTNTIERIHGTNFYRLSIPTNRKEKKWQKRLARDTDVLKSMLNLVVKPITVFGRSVLSFPDGYADPGQDPDAYRSQEVVGLLNLPDVELRSKGRGVVVAIIDTGAELTHPELASRLWTYEREAEDLDAESEDEIAPIHGWDFVDNDSDPSEELGDPATSVAGHGTFIAGVIALLAPEARIMPIRAFDPEGLSDAFTVAGAIKYAVDNGAHVINLSFGSLERSEVLLDAVNHARRRGVVLVAAVGNENESTDRRPRFPASWGFQAMGVAATNAQDHRAFFSNFGDDVSISAPGVQIISAYPGEGYAMWSGTSFAAPFVAAEAALILASEPRNPNVRRTIEDTSRFIDHLNPGFSGKLGKGRIDPLAALDSLGPVTAIRAEIKLVSSVETRSVRGRAEFSIDGTTQKFSIEADGLDVRAPHKLIVDGQTVIEGATNIAAWSGNFGGLKIDFSTTPNSEELLMPTRLLPVNGVRDIELRDAHDRIVLAGTFAPPDSDLPLTLIQKEARLLPTSPGTVAKGKARVETSSRFERLRIEADGLSPSATFRIIVDGQDIGAAIALSRAGDSGYLRAEFASDGTVENPVPDSIRPVIRIRRIEIRDLSGAAVLVGEFQSAGDHSVSADSGSRLSR